MTRRVHLSEDGFRISKIGEDANTAPYDGFLFHSNYISLRKWGIFQLLRGGFSGGAPTPNDVALGKTFVRPPVFAGVRWVDLNNAWCGNVPDPNMTLQSAAHGVYRGMTFTTRYDEDPDLFNSFPNLNSVIFVTRTRLYFAHAAVGSSDVFAEVLIFDNVAGS